MEKYDSLSGNADNYSQVLFIVCVITCKLSFYTAINPYRASSEYTHGGYILQTAWIQIRRRLTQRLIRKRTIFYPGGKLSHIYWLG